MVLATIMAFTKAEKKIERLVSKIWKDQEYTLDTIRVPDSLQADLGQVMKVVIDNETAGYVCYTTAFGCRVGGCAAPSNPNAQSYETFDYIVVYDPSFSILKVEVAEYGGQYGYEICRKKWLEQFEGSNSGFKLGDNIDGITGATVSATYLINDLNAVGQKIKLIKEEEDANI